MGTCIRMIDLTDGELHCISLEKQKNGCATPQALKAQEILYKRHNFSINDALFTTAIDASNVRYRITKKFKKEN